MLPSSGHEITKKVNQRLTIFAVPKPFEGHSNIIQRNALKSWVRLPGVEVVLLGDDAGIAEVAREFGAHHQPAVPTSELGTPLLRAVFDTARRVATAPVLCYVNADILLFDDFADAIGRIHFDSYLAVGQRLNLDVKGDLDLEDEVTRERFLRRAHEEGVWEPSWGSDFFAYPASVDWHLPDFAVGRAGWDNWMIFRGRQLGIPVVDMTPSVTVVHQNHGYEHVPKRSGPSWQGPETDRNLAALESVDLVIYSGTPDNATHVLRGSRVRRAFGIKYLRARLLLMSVTHPRLKPGIDLVRALYRKIRSRAVGPSG